MTGAIVTKLLFKIKSKLNLADDNPFKFQFKILVLKGERERERDGRESEIGASESK